MKRNNIVMGIFCAVCLSCIIGFNIKAEADFLDVLHTINSTSNTINSVNRAGRGTMSTVEYAQRFTDRQQDRKDRKRAEKEYNENAEAEYYRTIQETRALEQKYYSERL
ncbi:hypothetical protein IJD15_03410 [bacterium]|nr:hypothetical protein [bacterium]